MHEHVCDTEVALLDCRLYSMRDLVAFMYGNVSVHANVKIDVVIQAHLSGMAFLPPRTPGTELATARMDLTIFHQAPCP